MDVIKEKISQKQQGELDQKVLSEKQRTEREQNIHVPYHKPRQYTLQEFLSRKSLKKPIIEKGQKPRSAILELKKISENIEAFAQKMKEREEEAIEFFRSESESEAEEPSEDKENISANPSVPSETNNPQEIVVIENCKETEEVAPKTAHVEKSPEDLELERLTKKYENDEKQAEVEVKDEPELEVKAEASRPPMLKTLQEMGSKDFVIDLSSGAIEPRKLSGPELLFQKYMKSVQKPKQKEKVCMNIISVENGRIENQQIEVKLDKQFETDQSRPGEARGKLKEALWSKIETKRNKEMKLKADQMKEIVVEYEPEEKPGKEADDVAEDVEDEEVEGEEDEEEVEETDEDSRKQRKKSKKSGSNFIDDEVRMS